MKDMKKVEKEIKDELRQASRKSREDMDALKQQVGRSETTGPQRGKGIQEVRGRGA